MQFSRKSFTEAYSLAKTKGMDFNICFVMQISSNPLRSSIIKSKLLGL